MTETKADQLAWDQVSRLESQLAQRGYSLRAMSEMVSKGDHWTIVVKCASIIEAGINERIASAVTPQGAADFVATASVDRKLKLAKDLGVVGPKTAAAAKVVMKIRNAVVHDHSNLFTFDLAAYMAAHPDAQRELFEASGVQDAKAAIVLTAFSLVLSPHLRAPSQ